MQDHPAMTTRTKLPHQTDRLFISDGGLETTLIFHRGIELPAFSAIAMIASDAGRRVLREYFDDYFQVARRHRTGFILESPTWRASPDWAGPLGWSHRELERANADAIGLMHEIREKFETPENPMVVSGCVGPRGDGYRPSALMTPEDARSYHATQLRVFRDAGADMVSAFTMNYVEEALGIANAAASLDIPAVISFTVETDGKLPTGQTLREAIALVDAHADSPPAYYMINCAHPTHFLPALAEDEDWLERIRGIRANASCRSHAELDESTELDIGDPRQLGRLYRELQQLLPNLNVFGGCCGTDHRHIAAICEACFEGASAA